MVWKKYAYSGMCALNSNLLFRRHRSRDDEEEDKEEEDKESSSFHTLRVTSFSGDRFLPCDCFDTITNIP